MLSWTDCRRASEWGRVVLHLGPSDNHSEMSGMQLLMTIWCLQVILGGRHKFRSCQIQVVFKAAWQDEMRGMQRERRQARTFMEEPPEEGPARDGAGLARAEQGHGRGT